MVVKALQSVACTADLYPQQRRLQTIVAGRKMPSPCGVSASTFSMFELLRHQNAGRLPDYAILQDLDSLRSTPYFVPLLERHLLHLITCVCYLCIRPCRERLVAEREGAARAWESTLRSEQAAAQQALQDAAARGREVDVREASLKEEEQVWVRFGYDIPVVYSTGPLVRN